jgi:glutathione S-transferase
LRPRCISNQARDGLRWLDGEAAQPYLAGTRMTQADVSAVVAYEFARIVNPELFQSLQCARLDVLSARLSALEAFQRTAPPA